MVTEFFQETYHNLGATVGVTFAFGGNEKQVVVQPAPEPVVAAPAPVAVAPAPAPVVVAPAPAPVVVAKEIVSFDLLFDFDKSTIKDDMVPVLEQAKMILEEDSAVNFIVSGHTDSTGPEAYNQGLSERRAASVKNWLVSNGVSAARLEAVGYGETQPKYDNATREGRKLNRRVELQSK
ncbi:MAG: OmpA family protein [Desulfuromonadales bacterium]|nr:OmpA family protein [Desulfuromonadales bacterium]